MKRSDDELHSLTVEWRGRFTNKVQLAERFRETYQALDSLSSPGVNRLTIVYHDDFSVDPRLAPQFVSAAREALAYKDALTFGQKVATEVQGTDAIADQDTRKLVSELHRRPVSHS
jgi:hypothetical protein